MHHIDLVSASGAVLVSIEHSMYSALGPRQDLPMIILVCWGIDLHGYVTL